MKVIHLSTYDTGGGAAKATYRLSEGLRNIGVDSKVLVQFCSAQRKNVVENTSRVDRVIARLSYKAESWIVSRHAGGNSMPWSAGWFGGHAVRRANREMPDLVHLHWICGGFVGVGSVAGFRVPVVWTLHDSWVFTGGCHVPLNCLRYRESCGACPQLQSRTEEDLSQSGWKRKRKHWASINFRVVTPSKWLGNCAASSSLLRDKPIDIIPNGIDTTIFKRLDKRFARESLNCRQDKWLILTGGIRILEDPNKGFHHLLDALEILAASGWTDKVELMVFGDQAPDQLRSIPFETRFLGYLNDDLSMAVMYSAADVFVAPSTQENLPNTVMEALACGTPCVAFSVGGLSDLIEHEKTGYLANPFKPDDLAAGIGWVLSDGKLQETLSRNARAKVERDFSITAAAERYRRLYCEVLGK